jgi:prolycopene isomerase
MATTTFALDWPKIKIAGAAMGPKENYPTVVIGAGLGGLCAAAFLAREGFPVTVVEQHNIPGGYATSFDRAEGKFTFEVSLHGTAIKNNTTRRILEDLEIYDQLDLVLLPEAYRIKTPDHDIVIPQKDPETYIRTLSALFPDESDGIRSFVQTMLDLDTEVQDYDLQGKFSKKIFKFIFPLQYRRMWRIRNQTLADLLDDHVRTPALRGILAGMWGYYGLPPEKLSGFYYANATGAYLKNGSYTVKSRSQDLSNLMADTIEGAGGDIIYDTSVETILTENNRVKGVALSDGRTLPARVVVSNASALTTFNQMLPPGTVPADYLNKLNRFQPSISTFIVWLGLNRSIAGKIPGFSTDILSGNDPETDYRLCMDGRIGEVSFSVSIYDNLFEGYSLAGTSTITLLTLCGYAPWKRFETDYKNGNKTAYNLEKKRWADILIQRAEQALIPGLTAMIEVKESATPLTNWQFTGNPQGAIYGFEQSMDNAYMNRIGNRTPVKGLYLASAWGNPGGGYTGTLRAGAQTFKKIMTDWS